MNLFFIYVLYFFFYSAIGWFFESLYCSFPKKKWINRGFLTGPMCPIYGTGAVTLALCLTPIRDHLIYADFFGNKILITPIIVALVGMVLSDVVEFFTSLLMEKLFHAHWWDYTDKPLNIQGRICLSHTIYWGTGALIFIYYLHPIVAEFALKLPVNYIYFAIAIIAMIFLIDVAHSVRKAMDVRAFIDKFSALTKNSSILIKNLEEKFGTRVEDLKSEIHETTLKNSEHFNEWKSDITKQFRDSYNKLKKENRFVRGNPTLSQSIRKQFQSIEEQIRDLKKKLFDDNDDETKD